MEYRQKNAGSDQPQFKGFLGNDEWVTLIDKAASGDLEAAYRLAEGYSKGTFGNKDLRKAEKWCAYAAKKGHPGAIELLNQIRG